MESGDGLIVRVRPWCGTFSLAQARGLADAAEKFGNGLIDLTRRANLQIRGVSNATLLGLQSALADIGVIDDDAETEARRNVMVGPYAGAETRALAADLSDALLGERRLLGLPAKFGWLVDDGAVPSIVEQRADVALCLMEEGVALRLRERWLGRASRDCAVAAALALALGEQPVLAPLAEVPTSVAVPIGIAAPFGRLQARQFRDLLELAERAGASELRLSPWRAMHFDVAVDGAAALGLIIDAGDPLLRIDACPGAPDCRSSRVDTRGTALRLAARPFAGTIHVSGCAKGCARSAPADLVLVGLEEGYGVIRNGTTRDRIERHVLPEDL
jgi:precorrin-3B synthase